MSTFTCRWGILATGGIAESFSRDLLRDPASREVRDVRHEIVAVASSSSQQRSQDFIARVGADKQQGDDVRVAAYGSYEELVADANVDVIYIATPHSHHYDNVKLCLRGGKNVCCEKPFTVNSTQTEKLIALAREKNVFLMEAVWIRFFPIMAEIRDLLHRQQILGKILRSTSEFGERMPTDPNHRILNPNLAGGALLDIGIYPLTWQLSLLGEHPDNGGQPPKVTSSMIKSKATGVDEQTTLILDFERLGVQSTVNCNLNVKTHSFCTLVQGEKGDLQVSWAPMRPESYTFFPRKESDGDVDVQAAKTVTRDIPGHGMFWEADAVARCLRDGKKEADLCPLATTLLSQKIMETARSQNSLRYPDALEAAN